MNYRIVVTHSNLDHSDSVFIQERVYCFFWANKVEVTQGRDSFVEQLDRAHSELLNYIQYGN